MSIDATSTNFDEWVERWQKIRAACSGQHDVRKLKQRVLPKLGSQDALEYTAYLNGAVFTNYTGRTLEALLGMVYRKEPSADYPASFEEIYSDIDLGGNSAALFSQHALSEVLKTGRFGVLVEYPQAPAQQISLADAQAFNLRPYLSGYATESIVDYRVERVNNKMQPTMIKLRELVDEWESETTKKQVEQYRLLLLTEDGYVQRVYRKGMGGWSQFGDDIVPTKNGMALGFIPFFVFGPQNNTLDPQEPPLEDLADLNLAHFRNSASYERGCLFTGAPTPVLAGFVLGDNQTLQLGSTSAITTADPQAKWGYLEFTGQGLAGLVDAMKLKESQMAAIGARMLAPEKNGVEAQGTLEIRTNGETSALAMIAKLVSAGMSAVLSFMSDWQGLGSVIKFELNTDYMPRSMTAQELTALMAAWQGGGISKEDLFYNLAQGEIIRPGVQFEQYQDETSQAPLSNL